MKRLLLAVICSMISCGAFAHAYRKDTVFYRDNNEKCHMEVSYIKGAADKPVIVWFHGGGLTGGNAKTPQTLLKEDYLIFSVSYRLYPSVSVREIIDDAAAAVSWVVKNAGQYGGAVSKIYLSGHSAGGYLVSMLALDKSYLSKHDVDADIFAGVIPLSGQMITHFTERKSRGMGMPDVIIDDMAPLNHLRADAPPFLIVTGDRDMEMARRFEENSYFYEMMKFVGHKDITLYELGGFNHGGMNKPGQQLLMNYIKSRINLAK